MKRVGILLILIMVAIITVAALMTLSSHQAQTESVRQSVFDYSETAAASSSSSKSGSYEEGVVLIRFKTGVTEEAANEAIADTGLAEGFVVSQAHIDAGEYLKLALKEGVSVDDAVATFKALACADAVQPNYRYGVAAGGSLATW